MAPRVAVVTGATGGIGSAAARAFHAAGHAVVLAARDEARAQGLAKELGSRALAVRCDVRSWPDIQALARAVEEAHGRCDVLVNNAGVGIGGSVLDMPVEHLDETLEVNLRGYFLVAKAIVPLMPAGGTVLNVGSVAGREGFAGLAAYCASKAGVRAFSEALGREVAERGLRVVLVAPGFVDTQMVEGASYAAEDMVRPAELAEVMVRMCDQPESVYVDEVLVWPRRLYTE